MDELIRKFQQDCEPQSGDREIFQLCDKIRETGFRIHNYLRSGHAEKVYENALFHRLQKQGIAVLQKQPLKVVDEDGTLLGRFEVDLIVENKLLIEVKACRLLVDEHVAQLLGYLRACDFEHGLLVNFGAQKFQIKKYILSRERFL